MLELNRGGENALPSRARRIRKTTLLIASTVTESARRWSRRLNEKFAVCEVAERRALEHVIANLKPDILVLDLALPSLCRVRSLRDIQRLSPSTKILALTDSPGETEGVCALKAGAKGYYTRTLDPEHLLKAVEAIERGEIWVQRKLVPRLVTELVLISEGRDRSLHGKVGPLLEGLTERQRMIAELISRGVCNKEIASQLNISERTVKAHLTEAFRKVGVADRLQLALLVTGDARPSG